MGQRSSVEDLIGLAPPPEWRVDAGSPEQWGAIERTLGTALPNDYKLIINIYGSGEFNDLFALLNPFAPHGGGNLVDQAFRRVSYGADPHLDCYEEHQGIFPELGPFATFPEPGGLLPMGSDSNGGYAFWLTGGRPDDWPLILYPYDFSTIERYPMPLVDFLCLWISGRPADEGRGVWKHFVNRTTPVFRPA